MTPRIILAAIGCYFVTMSATVTGIQQTDRRIIDVVHAYGGGQWRTLIHAQLRSAMPSILAGLRVAAPNAVLGSILAEFGGGGRYGLGVYLIGSLGRGEPDRLWGIGLSATVIAGLAYLLFSLIATRLTGTSKAVDCTRQPSLNGIRKRNILKESRADHDFLRPCPFLLWWLLLAIMGTPAMIAKTPAGLFDYLFLTPKQPCKSWQTRLCPQPDLTHDDYRHGSLDCSSPLLWR